MDLKQIEKKVQWLDEERRKDKNYIAHLEERITSLEGQLSASEKKNYDLDNELSKMKTHLKRIEKFDEEIYDLIMEMFDTLPICGLADKKYFITHGGISPELKKISKVNKIDRFIEIPMDGIMCDLMWADPADEKEAKNFDFIENHYKRT